jgi:pyrimidine-specific ribonucleoside hydrolase
VITHYRSAYRARYGVDAVALHDAVAVLEAVVPGTLATEPMPLHVACDLGPARGATVRVASGPTVEVAVDVAEGGAAALLAEILRRLTGPRTGQRDCSSAR